MRRAFLGLTTAAALATVTTFGSSALAQKPADPPPASTDVAVQGTMQGDQMGEQREVTADDVTRAANAEPGSDQPNSVLPEAPLEAPPPPPRHKGLVLESSLGALGFLGKFGSEAPTAFWLHTQLGYEIFKWLMIYGEGELAFTDTSNGNGPTQTRAFPIFGFGGGPRLTVHFTDRVAMFVQGDIGAMKSDVTTGALTNVGFKNAEALSLYFGGRLGIEWYQIDRHIALGLQVGLRDATGFKRVAGSDLPLMIDGGLALRYTF